MTSSVNDSGEITADEAQRYDRQLRIWGHAAQYRLKLARVLLVGLSGINSEVAKNLALAGIGCMVIIDNAIIGEEDLQGNLFVRDDDLGKNIALVAVPRIQELNPLMKVIHDPTNIATKSEEFLQSFDAICIGRAPLKLQIRINNLCRKSTSFFTSFSFGLNACFFTDLETHSYETINNSEKRPEDEQSMKTKCVCSMQEMLAVPWSMSAKKIFKKRLKSTACLWFTFQLIIEFTAKHPLLSLTDESTFNQLLSFREQRLNNESMDDSFLLIDTLRRCANGFNQDNISVCAIVGGLLSQEILKSVSHRDEPLDNLCVFWGWNGEAVCAHITSVEVNNE